MKKIPSVLFAEILLPFWRKRQKPRTRYSNGELVIMLLIPMAGISFAGLYFLYRQLFVWPSTGYSDIEYRHTVYTMTGVTAIFAVQFLLARAFIKRKHGH